MNDPRSQQSSSGMGALGWILFVSRALSVSVEVFLHRVDSFGERYLGLQAGAAFLLIFFFPVLCERHDPTPLLYFLGAYFFMCVCVKARIQKRRKAGGPQPHSYYAGYPLLLRSSGARHETRVKAVLEPLIVWIAGAALMTVSVPLGSYLLVAGVGLAISVNSSLALERKRALDLHDAFMEQRGIAERFREFRGD
jgi:hypothetical protein